MPPLLHGVWKRNGKSALGSSMGVVIWLCHVMAYESISPRSAMSLIEAFMTELKSESCRVRTVTWEDPKVSARDATTISGFNYLCSIKEGKIKPPPVAVLLGYRVSEVEMGRAVFELEPAEYHYNPLASVHGGVVTTLLDSAMTAAIISTLPIGIACSTLEMKVNFIRPITSETGLVRCEGKIIHVGSRTGTAEGKLIGHQGKLYAHAVNTCMIFRARQEP